MKKFLSFFATLALALGFTACEDVPAPFAINDEGGTQTGFYYMSNNLSSGWTLKEVEGKGQPWSQGSSYVQATGFQKWDGADQKSNKEVEGWLISPAFNTAGAQKLKFSFDYTIKYTNNVPNTWKGNHKVLASKDYNGVDVNSATWTEINVNLVESPHSDWTLYTSGEVQLPDEFVGAENLRIAFWFYAPASGSTTWELQNFKLEEGEAGEGSVDDSPNYKFVKATQVEDGKQYLIVADGKIATPIASDKNFGYLGASPVGIKDGYIVVKGLTNAFTFSYDNTTVVENLGGNIYNIKQSDGRMLYRKDANQKNFDVAETPDGEKGWIISKQQDGTFYMVVANVGTFIQYSKQYTSFGCYSTEQDNAVYPDLYELVGETDEEVTQPEGGDTPGGDTPTPATGENLLQNGDFEAWTGGQPDNWKSTNSASTATLSQSTDAHGGSYAVNVAAQASANKRLAYKEITLKAGTYTIQFYAKGGQCRVGYVPTKDDGTLGTYSYGGYVDLKADEWTLVSHEFTLSAQTKVNVVVMNPMSNSAKSYEAKNLTIDDFSLTTSNGGIADGGSDPGTTTPTETAQFRKVTSVTSGKQYLIVAENGGQYYAAQPVPASKSYNYLTSAVVTASGDVITADPANAFTLVYNEGAYKIQQPDGRFLYMDETHNSFQVNAAPNEGFVWTVAIEPTAGYFKITNVARNKYVQLSTQNNNTWGSYPEAKEGGVMPRLYERVQ